MVTKPFGFAVSDYKFDSLFLRTKGLILLKCFPVLQEFLNAVGGERMADHLGNDFIRDGSHIATGFGGFDDVDRVANTGADDLGLGVLMTEDFGNVLDQGHALASDVIQSAKKGADVGGAGARGKEGLCGREDEGYVGADALGRQDFDGLQALGAHGDLDDDIGVDGGQLEGFRHHFFVLQRDNLGRDRAVDNGGNFLYHLFEVPSLLGDQRGIGGNAADDAQIPCFLDFGYVCRIDKDFHNFSGIAR